MLEQQPIPQNFEGPPPNSQPALRLRVQSARRHGDEGHRKLDELYRMARAPLARGERAEAQAALRHFGEALESHLFLEDMVHFPSLRSMCPEFADALQALSQEHDRLRRGIRELQSGFELDSCAALLARLDALAQWLGVHEFREETLTARIEQASRAY